MNKKLFFASLLFVFALVVFVSAQAGYILQVFLLSVLTGTVPQGAPTPAACTVPAVLNNATNTTGPPAYVGCVEGDGGFNPVVGSYVSFSGLTVPGGALVCTSTAGDWCQSQTTLNEIVCGGNVAPTYSSIAAVVQVDCAAYAAANPQLGLQGVCANNPSNQAGQCA